MTHTPELPLQMRRNGFAPVDELARARDDQGLQATQTPFGGTAYLVCRHEDVREVLSDPERFSSARVLAGAGGDLDPEARAGTLPAFDPPEHTRLRRLLMPEFKTFSTVYGLNRLWVTW
ncbi:hypothetical protein ACFYRY_38710 [Streptomyces sp. NPDC005263]|uniref:hypothetical protein n=1 Tax=Streptomyces sp. NPDC005263 TaxID=3364711 RepID=UPI0036954A75